LFHPTATDARTTRTDQAKDALEVVLCGNSQEIQAEDKGFEQPSENAGIPAATDVGGANPTRAAQLPNNKAAKNDLLATAQRSIHASRTAIAKWIDATPLDDHCTLEKLGPILAELREAESILESLEPLNIA
jgi:hypothetical protein